MIEAGAAAVGVQMKTRGIIPLLLAAALLLCACGGLKPPASGAANAVDHPDDLPQGASALQLEAVDIRSKTLVCVSGVAGKYDAQSGFSALSEQVYTLALCAAEDAFCAYLWDPALDGATSRTQLYGINSFVSFYDRCVEQDLFYPTACSVSFNEAGEIIELYECAD